MSWKLAELRWRHDVGLYGSRWEKESGALPVERMRAIEVFERRGRKSRSLSPSRRAANANLVSVEKDLGLGEPLLPASPAARSPINPTTRRTTPTSQPSRGRGFSCSSLLSLPRTTSSPTKDIAAACQSPLLDCVPILNDFAPPCQHAAEFSRGSSRVRFPTAEPGQRIDLEASHRCKYLRFLCNTLL
jgi:hypothetical protein